METLRAKNKHLPFFHVNEAPFAQFGRVLTAFDFSLWLNYLDQKTAIPETGNVYVASEAGLENLAPFNEIGTTLFGAMPIQAGYCNGNNSFLGGLEYHKTIEICIAQTDLVLQLADYADLQNFVMDSKNVKAFFMPKGCAIELKPTALHLAPCKLSDAGFKSIIVLPKGVNTDLPANCPIQKNDPESRLLFKTGKWMLAHPENPVPLSRGAVAAITGANLQIHY